MLVSLMARAPCLHQNSQRPSQAALCVLQSSPHWAPKFDPEEVLAGKTKLAAVAMRARTPLRKALRANCLAQPTKCTHADPPAIIHRDGPAFAATVFELFQDAWFCLQPPGDTAVRLYPSPTACMALLSTHAEGQALIVLM